MLPESSTPFIANAPMFGFADVKPADLSTQLSSLDRQLTEARSILGLADEPLPLGVGFITFQSGGFIQNAIPILRKHRVAAVWLSFPQADVDHDAMVQAIREHRDWDTKVFVQVGTVAAAKEAIRQGVDVLVVQGTDAGGHQWAHGASLISLLPEVRDVLSAAQNTTTAILAAGGIVDGRGCVAALGLADGIVMGTRFVSTFECPAPSAMKQTIVSSTDGGVSTVKSVQHDVFQSTDVFPRQYDGRAVIGISYEDSQAGVSNDEVIRRYNEARQAGEDQRRTVWAGASVGSINAVLSVDEVLTTTRQEARAILERMRTVL
ncbi:unnamed protein product [Penicillium salamii]|uniref:Nitronate monooxygenase domain-containing protein n=1 Tax=Penicillium salamii TaxID=1612424 RepID=A0A9W4IM05_9EURO|nr:unnamed protein product [Penicillium salamii]CAG8194623.1 unnamed protein product [Penicillium salamii]CAG8202278.1 unnamed protein product [Penicillium salamii]CAG8207079.1 unnamed protein product [Penicillium salamii]CAG8328625.1 unnamed protein product [Penicillium salamii]